ncbi:MULTISPECIES: group II intron maturase-specific domain-containing protein [unclassified Pseudomonas]|uniref:group II intron maturase-specific domain-containing protein n=1 Tax=unclassified Pseudomonas TaxID=196821 RepID=UPI0010F7C1EC|nr:MULTISPECIES: group II intron maturase-specific domain-containing protein [unclassified Pseudomonas]
MTGLQDGDCHRANKPVLRGWAGYFKLSQSKRPLGELDGWVRHKLRCVKPNARANVSRRAASVS